MCYINLRFTYLLTFNVSVSVMFRISTAEPDKAAQLVDVCHPSLPNHSGYLQIAVSSWQLIVAMFNNRIVSVPAVTISALSESTLLIGSLK